MSEKIIEHFRKFVDLDPSDEWAILSFFKSKTYSKRENLFEPNKTCRYHFFVVKGCLRLFFITQKGHEQTIQFAIENWWLTDYFSFENKTVSDFTIQAVEKTHVMIIDNYAQEKLLNEFPILEKYFRQIFQRAYSASQLRTKYLSDFSREEFYQHFNDNFPEFTKRVPQHLLASYLNMTPEYLSEIKRKKRS
jgi:CRP-like cAMP-binding protein